MAITWNREEGRLPTSTAVPLYTASSTVLLFSVAYHNISGSTVTVTFQLRKAATTTRILAEQELAPGASLFIDTKFTLESGDMIQGTTSSVDTVDYWLSMALIS